MRCERCLVVIYGVQSEHRVQQSHHHEPGRGEHVYFCESRILTASGLSLRNVSQSPNADGRRLV
jgi:hypothetical protein